MKLALFDLANTLLSGNADTEWLDFLIEQGVLPASDRAASKAMGDRYGRDEATPLEYVHFHLGYYRRHDMAALAAWRDAFIKKKIQPLMLPAAQRLVEQHRHDLVAIISSTNRFLIEPIAAAFGVEHLIATEPQIANGRFTGDIVGAPCLRSGKVARLGTWLASRGEMLRGFEQSWFYSDSINDLPLLEQVTHPVAVDPDARLAAIADERGWARLTLRAVPA